MGVLGPLENPTADNYVSIETQGKGHFVNQLLCDSHPMWYGEGDDMVYYGENFLLIGTEQKIFSAYGVPKNLIQVCFRSPINDDGLPKHPYLSLLFMTPFSSKTE